MTKPDDRIIATIMTTIARPRAPLWGEGDWRKEQKKRCGIGRLGACLLLFRRSPGCSLRKLHALACLFPFLNVHTLLLKVALVSFEVAPLCFALEWHDSSLQLGCGPDRLLIHFNLGGLLDISFATSVTALTCNRSCTLRCLALRAAKLVLSRAATNRIRAFF